MTKERDMYIDVRGPQPILFCGMRAYELRDCPRTITVSEALNWLILHGFPDETPK